jgi:hypothetical protein
LMRAHGLSAASTVHAGCKAFVVSAFMLFEGQAKLTGRDDRSAPVQRR